MTEPSREAVAIAHAISHALLTGTVEFRSPFKQFSELVQQAVDEQFAPLRTRLAASEASAAAMRELLLELRWSGLVIDRPTHYHACPVCKMRGPSFGDPYHTDDCKYHKVLSGRDVRNFPPEPVDEWRVDFIVGGDPCQENSAARQTDNCRHPSLGHEFIRVVDALRPRLVLRENPTRVRADAPWPWWRFRQELERLGYVVLPFRLRACCLGAEHRRDRLFLLAESVHSVREGLEGPRKSALADANPCEPFRRERLSAADVVRRRSRVPNYVDRIRCLGNAVCPPVAELIGRMILASIGEHEPRSSPSTCGSRRTESAGGR